MPTDLQRLIAEMVAKNLTWGAERIASELLVKWTSQQFRMVVSGDQTRRWVIHDRDSIYSEGVDGTVAAMGVTILKTPARVLQRTHSAND